MTNAQLSGTPFSKTGTSGTAVVVTLTGTTALTYYVTDISGSSDLATATLIVKDGSTAIWQETIGSATPYQHTFNTPLKVAVGNDLSITVTGTTVCKANIAGFTLP